MKRIFPSYPAAIAVGAVGTPLITFGFKIIEQVSESQWLQALWGIVSFILPLFFATFDREEAALWRRKRGFFGSFIAPASKEAFRRLYIPAWKRMGVGFVSIVVSAVFLKLIGVNL